MFMSVGFSCYTQKIGYSFFFKAFLCPNSRAFLFPNIHRKIQYIMEVWFCKRLNLIIKFGIIVRCVKMNWIIEQRKEKKNLNGFNYKLLANKFRSKSFTYLIFYIRWLSIYPIYIIKSELMCKKYIDFAWLSCTWI